MQGATDEAEAAVPRMLAPRILEVVEYPSWVIGAAGVLKQPKPVDKAESWAALLGALECRPICVRLRKGEFL